MNSNGKKSNDKSSKFPRLSSNHSDIGSLYDVIVVGSGYGASIAASRCARAGQKVCILERGKEWLPGDFPESMNDARKQFQISNEGKPTAIGDPTDLYEVIISKDITVVQGCGLGGTSLINANVALDADPRTFEDARWPQELRDDMNNLIDVDRKHVHEMMRPTEYPDHYPKLKKNEAMEKAAKGLGLVDIEDIGKIFRKTPLLVNFDKEKTNETQHRFDQPACNGCGNCCSGCNTGAKNTLNMNYLPDAKVHGAKIFTEVSVVSVKRDPYASLWKVYYKRLVEHKGLNQEEQIVRASYVILGAGSIGSTKILLKSQERGLEISEKIGSRFTGNGDALGFSYHGDDDVNSIGLDTGKYDEIKEDSPGPTITSVIDLRSLEGVPFKDGIVIEDGTPPGASETVLEIALAFASKTLGVKTFPASKKFDKFIELLKDEEMKRTLAFLCMSHDDSTGVVRLDPKSNGAFVKWEDVGHQKIFDKINERLQQITTQLGGTYIINPVWSSLFDKQLITVHPLGGCPMAEDGESGVVNHKGQVFIGDTDDTHPGLYVMDGAIVPTSVGVNPVMTISMLAERCCRLLIEDAEWKVDYDLFKDFNTMEQESKKPGIRFSEKMTGQMTLNQTGDLSNCEFVVTVESQDLEHMLYKDRNHEGTIVGTVTCPGLSPKPLTISSGIFRFFVESKSTVDTKEMLYKFDLSSEDGSSYRFIGKKHIKADKVGETGLADTTTLFVDIYQGTGESGPLAASGVLNIGFRDFAKQLDSMEIINSESTLEKLQWKVKFGKFFSAQLWDTYSGISDCKYLDPNAPPRVKRPLRLGKAVPIVYKVKTNDKVELRVTRYQGGGKGPLIACHGMGTNTILFTLDTIETNFLEYFLEREYDVWLFDTRLSTSCPWICALHSYSIDDIINYDIPAGVDKVLEITGEKDVQILVHCVSSVAFWGSLLAGKLNGKIRTAIISQSVALPEGSFMNQLKSKAHLSHFLDSMGVKTVTAYTDKHDRSATMNCFSRKVANISTSKDEHCSSDVCHRITFYYGLIYEHGNFNVATHDILHELFGTAAAGYFHHLSRCFRSRRLVDKDGNDIYIPGVDKDGNCIADPSGLEWVKNVDVPIYMFSGTENESFKLSSVKRMYEILKKVNPHQDYGMDAIPGYGHVDHFIGKTACYDVWPKIHRFLDKYAENNLAKNKKIVRNLKKVLNTVKMVAPDRSEIRTEAKKLEFPLLTAEREVNSFASPFADSDDDSDDSDDSNGDDSDLNLEDATPDEVPELRKKISGFLQDEKFVTWQRKKMVKTAYRKPPEYHPPTADENSKEKIVVEKVLIADNTEKREIYVLSDMHLGGEWSKGTVDKLKDFVVTLARVAEQFVHTIVFLGDIFEMWMTPITCSPPSKAEFIEEWKKNEVVAMTMKAIQKMAEDDGVRVYYIRGNHDVDMDASMIRDLFGEKVTFIPGKLIYLINTGHQEYRIRFEHGHDYDLFNCLDLAPVNSPLQGRPIGYYISRCAQSSKEKYFSDTEMVIQSTLRWFLSVIPNKFFGSTIAELSGKAFFQKKLLKRMFEEALDLDITEEACILLEDGKWVRIMELIKYPFIKLAISKYGSSRVFSMYEGALGNFEDFLLEMGEDVIVLGHTHNFRNTKFVGKLKNMYYINSGTWIDLADHFSFVKMIPPKKNEDGLIQVEFNSNKSESPNAPFAC